MMRLIDADGLKTYITECSQEGQYRVYAGYAVGFIDGAPTVDAVPVVRCMDCKHREDPENCPAAGWKFAMEPYDFCSYGEREVSE